MLAAFRADCSLKYFQFAPSVLAMHSPHEHVNTLAKPRLVSPFVPLSKWFSGHKGTVGNTEGGHETGRFLLTFSILFRKPEGKNWSVGEWSVANSHLKGGRSSPQALVVRNNVVVIGGWGDLDLIDVFNDLDCCASL